MKIKKTMIGKLLKKQKSRNENRKTEFENMKIKKTMIGKLLKNKNQEMKIEKQKSENENQEDDDRKSFENLKSRNRNKQMKIANF